MTIFAGATGCHESADATASPNDAGADPAHDNTPPVNNTQPAVAPAPTQAVAYR